ncbi:hypothetical protein [Enterobacter mori]|uniref:hypothetical protein n=1 Tax=Enterobacter mori TaxID=539813 RepID=UPI003AAABCD6
MKIQIARFDKPINYSPSYEKEDLQAGESSYLCEGLFCLYRLINKDVQMKFKDLKIGDVFESKNFGEFVIVKIIDSQNVYIRFPSTGYTKLVEMASIRLRSVKDWMKPTFYGIGVRGDELPAQVDGKMVKEYVTWKEMLRRIVDEKSLQQFPTYRDCSVCERWLYYPHFYQDVRKLPGYIDWYNNTKSCKYNLNKDIKVPGSKIYSPNTCMFVTSSENSLDANRHRHNP